MESKYKTLIPLIIIFFIVGVAIGYVAHKPKTIEIEKTVENIVYKNTTVYVTVTPTHAPIVTATATAIETPLIGDFSVKNYESSKDTPTKTIELVNRRANPDDLSIHPGDSVLIQITDYRLQTPLKLTITSLRMSDERTLTSGGVSAYITFNNKGTYNFKAIVSLSDPNIQPWTYAEGRIVVY